MYTEAHIFEALKSRFCSPEWLLLKNIRNTTGYQGIIRYADAIALNLWPSRGLTVIGFEIKSHRQDWLSELKNPKKSESHQQFCHKWYLTIGNESIVQKEELPSTWGLLTVKEHKETIKIKILKEAPELEPKPFTNAFAFSLLRCAAFNSEQAQEVKKAYQKGLEDEHKSRESYIKHLNNRIDELNKQIADIEKQTGLNFNGFHAEKNKKLLNILNNKSTLSNLLPVFMAQQKQLQRQSVILNEAVELLTHGILND